MHPMNPGCKLGVQWNWSFPGVKKARLTMSWAENASSLEGCFPTLVSKYEAQFHVLFILGKETGVGHCENETIILMIHLVSL